MTTNNSWDAPYPDVNGETLIGSGTSTPVSTTITSGSNCTVVNTAGGIQLTYTGAASGAWVLTHSASASASSELTFTGITSTYFIYMIVVDNYVPATDGDRFLLQTSTNAGVSYDSGSSDYYFRGWEVPSGATESTLDAEGAFMNIIGSAGIDPGNASNETGSCITYLYNPSASDFTRTTSQCECIDSSGGTGVLAIECGRKEAVAVDAFRLYCSGGNITTAEVRVYGMVAS